MLTLRQQTALKFPCARGIETLRDRFRLIEGNWSSILTVNK